MIGFRRHILPVAALILVLCPGLVRGEIRLLGDWTYLWSESTLEQKDSGESSKSTVEGFDQIYRLDIDRQVYPNLLVSAGVLAEDDSLTTERQGQEVEITTQTVRPYIDLELNTGLYRLAAGYRESEVESSVSGQESTSLFAETWDLRGDWQPTGLPSIEGSFTRTLRHDEPRTVEQQSDLYRFSSRYEWRNYEFNYFFLRNEEIQEIRDSESTVLTHNGRVRYARNFMDNRIKLNMRAQVEKSTVEFSGSGERIVETISRGPGFYLLEDTDPLDDSPPGSILPSGDFVFVPPGSFTAVNLGLGGAAPPVSLGLSFGDQVRADRVRIFLQSDSGDPNPVSPAQVEAIANSSRWRAFVSDDQLDWNERAVSSVVYDQTDNYIEIRFSPATEIEALKVTFFPPVHLPGDEDIIVRDLQAFFSLSEGEDDQIVTVSRNFSSNLSWRATDRTRFGYNMAYQDLEVDTFEQEQRKLTNGVNVNHEFNSILSALGRVLRTDEWNQGSHDTVTHNYSSQLVARYLPTLNQSLTYSGSHTSDPDGTAWSNSVYLRTNAELYQGWDASLDTGYNWQEDPEQGKTSSVFLRLQNSIVPHRSLSVIFDYSARWVQQEMRDNTFEQTARLRGHWSPTDAFSLLGEVSHRDTEQGTLTDWELGANWLPLRDGTLQANITYSELGDTDDRMRRSISPSLVWRISRYIYLNLTYSYGQQEDLSRTADFQNFQANLRVYYY